MCCFLATLGAADIDGAGLELDRRPLQAAELRDPQSVAETYQDHRCVAVAVAVALGRLDQALDLTLGQVLAGLFPVSMPKPPGAVMRTGDGGVGDFGPGKPMAIQPL